MAAAPAPQPVPQFKTGMVKEVPSGDTMVIMGMNWSNGPPPTKTVCLGGLDVPRVGRRENPDEPFAWGSREFLRKKVIGKAVRVCVLHARVPAVVCVCACARAARCVPACLCFFARVLVCAHCVPVCCVCRANCGCVARCASGSTTWCPAGPASSGWSTLATRT